MQNGGYLLVTWDVRSGMETQFEEAWHMIAAASAALPQARPFQAVLLQDRHDPRRFEALHRLPSLDVLEHLQTDLAVQAAVREAEARCTRVRSRACRWRVAVAEGVSTDGRLR